MSNTIIHSFVKRSRTTTIHVPNQVIPFICVFIIAKTPTYLLVGFVLGYMIVHKRVSSLPLISPEDNSEERRMIELPPPLRFDNEIHHAPVNHFTHPLPLVHNNGDSSTLDIKEIPKEGQSCMVDDEDISNGSIEFEKLMRFPRCPTTLPRLDTHFNFIVDYHQDMKKSGSSNIDWSAIHQELEYDQQRQQDDHQHKDEKQVEPISEELSHEHPRFMIQGRQKQHPQQDMVVLSSASSSEEEEALVLFPVTTVQVAEKSAPIISNSPTWLATPLPHDNKPTINCCAATSTAAILFVENEVEEQNNNEKTNLFNNSIEDMLLLPTAPFPSKPSYSSPGQLFKSKFQSAVKKMKKKSSIPISKKEEEDFVNGPYCKRSSACCANIIQFQNDLPSDAATSKKAHSLQIHAYFPSPSTSYSSQSKNSTALSPRPSASARMHDHFKGRLNKLFKK